MPTKQKFAIKPGCPAFTMLDYFFDETNSKEVETILNKNLHGDVDGKAGREPQAHLDICNQVYGLGVIFKFLRRFPVELSDVVVRGDIKLAKIEKAFGAFDFDEFEEVFYHGLVSWIHTTNNDPQMPMQYVASTSALYVQSVRLIQMCEEYYKAVTANN